MRIRVARPEEYERLGQLTAAAYAGSVSEGYLEQLGNVAGRTEWSVVLVAIDGEAVLGGAAYVPSSGADGDASATKDTPDDVEEAGIRMLAVAPEARRRGVGTALVEECISLARHDGRCRIRLHTTPSMTAAQRLYERLGFERATDRDYWIGPDLRLLGYVLELDR